MSATLFQIIGGVSVGVIHSNLPSVKWNLEIFNWQIKESIFRVSCKVDLLKELFSPILHVVITVWSLIDFFSPWVSEL